MNERTRGRLKWAIPLFILIVLFLVIRAIAPGIILKQINSYLADFSETYYAHIEDVDLNLWRGSYSFDRAIVSLKKTPDKPFLRAREIDISVAWRELLRGRILTDVIVDEALLEGDAQFTDTAKKNTKQSEIEAREAGSKLFPVEIERIEIKNSKMNYLELNLFVDQIDARLSHFTATEKNPLSLLTLKGLLLGKAPIKAVGDLNFVSTPAAWVIAAELQNFNTVDSNKIVKKYLPLTFKKGDLDIYTEIKSEKGRITGYIKPFLNQAEIVGDDNDFKSIKHLGVEVTIALVNLLFRSSDDHTVATRILFSYDKSKFKWNVNEMLSSLFKNGYREKLSPGIENTLSLSETQNKEKKK